MSTPEVLHNTSQLLITSIFITLSSRHPTSAQWQVWYILYWANLPPSLVGPPPTTAHTMSSHVPHHLQTLQVCNEVLGHFPQYGFFPNTPSLTFTRTHSALLLSAFYSESHLTAFYQRVIQFKGTVVNWSETDRRKGVVQNIAMEQDWKVCILEDSDKKG